MIDSLVAVYSKLSDAEKVRLALIDAGFADEDVDLSARGDEAGAVAGNFTVGNGRKAKGDMLDGSLSGPGTTYHANYAVSKEPELATCVLTVTVHSAQERELADKLLHDSPRVH